MMDRTLAATTELVPKKIGRGRIHISRALQLALDATVPDTSARSLAQERGMQHQQHHQQRSAANEPAAHSQQGADAAAELSRLQLAHAATLVELVQYKKTASAGTALLQQQLQDKGVSLSAAEACKQAALNDLAAEKFALQAATSQVAVLQQQLAVSQDSLAQLQDKCQAAQDETADWKKATFVAEARLTDLELSLEDITASRSETQRRCDLMSADLAAHEAAATTAECKIASLHAQLQDSNNRCAELEVAHQAYDDLAQQASAAAAASAAAFSRRVQELEVQLQYALAKLHQLQLAKDASLDLLTDITADSIVSKAACEFVMGHMLKAADAAAKAQRDKYAIRDAEARGWKWQVAKSVASNRRLQQEAARLHQQLAAVAETAVQLKVQLQTTVWGRTAALLQAEAADTATWEVKQQLHVAIQQLADAEDQLFGWACAAAATSLSVTSAVSSPAHPADGVPSSPAPTVLLQSSLPSPSQAGSSQHSQSASIEPGWKPLAQPAVPNLPHQQLPVSAKQAVCVSAYAEVPAPALLADQAHRLQVAPGSTASKPPVQVPKLRKSLNKIFRRLGVLCSGGLSKRSTSSEVLDEGVTPHDPVLNSFLGGQDTSTVPAPRTLLHGSADLDGQHTKAAFQGIYSATAATAAAAAEHEEPAVAAAVLGMQSGITGSTAVAAPPHRSRWGNAAAGTGLAEYSSPRTTSDTAVSYNFTEFVDSGSATAEGPAADVAVGSILDTEVDDDDDVAVDGETVAVTVVEKGAGTKANAPAVTAMTDVEAMAGV